MNVKKQQLTIARVSENKDIQRFRKQVLYVFASLEILANGGALLSSLFRRSPATSALNASLTNLADGGLGREIRLLINLGLLVMWLVIVFLARRNRLHLAGIFFCVVSTPLVSLSFASIGLETNIALLYVLDIVIASVFITPRMVLLFGFISSLCYVAIAGWLINIGSDRPAQDWVNVVILCGIMLAISFVLYGFNQSITRLVQSVQLRVTETGRLYNTLKHQREVEMAVIGQLKELTDVLARISTEQQLTKRQQSNIISQVASATEELNLAARQIADNALAVATVAEKADQSSLVGQQLAEESVSTISTVREAVQVIDQEMHQLNLQIERVEEVTVIIEELADETELLALNASIEAAGAGSYGRRFAAVAEEVHRLANRSRGAVGQIKELVEEIIRASNRTVRATGQGLNEARAGGELINKLSEANSDIIQFVSQTSALSHNIAGVTQQQRESSNQIVSLVNAMQSTSEQLNRAEDEVNQLMTALTQTSTRFIEIEKLGQEKPNQPAKQPPASLQGLAGVRNFRRKAKPN